MILLVDGNSVGWTVWHALPKSIKESDDMGLVCGVWRHAFLTKLIKLVKKIGNGRAVYTLVVWDGKKGAKNRRVLCEQYKKKRSEERRKAKERKDDVNLRYFEAVKIFKKMLKETQTGQKLFIRIDELEADDSIAALCVVTDPDTPVVVYSGDMDLLQLLQYKGVRVIAPRDDKEWDAQRVMTRFWVKPEYLWVYKAVVGDPSDEWVGIKGVGEKKFKKVIQEKGIHGVFKEWQDREEFKLGEKLCKLPAEWLLEQVFGGAWESVFLEMLDNFLQVELDPAEIALALDLRKLSTADLQYLM